MKSGQRFVSLSVDRVVKLNIKPSAGVNRALRVLSCGAVRLFVAFWLIAALSLCFASRAGAQVCNAPCQQYADASLHGTIDVSSLSATLKAVAAGDTIIVPMNWGPGNPSAPNCASVKVTDNATGGSNTYVIDKVVYPVYWPNATYPFCFAQLHTLGGVHGSPTIITATVSPVATQEINVTAVDFAGILTSADPVDVSVTQQQASANDTGYTDNPSLTTATNGEILVESMGFSAGIPGPPSSGWNTCDPKISTMCNWRVAASAGSYSASYGANGAQQWVTILTAYKVAGSAATPPPVTSPQITVTPSSLNFGSVPAGTSSTQTIEIHNNGTTPVTLGPLVLLGPGFDFAGLPSDLLMGAGTSLTFNVVFNPNSAGTYSGSLPVIANGVTVDSIPLSGTGTGSTSGSSPPVPPVTSSGMTVTPASVSFGSVATGTSSSQTITIHNNGTSRLSLASPILSAPGFSLSGVPSDLLMGAGTSLTFKVVFNPSSAGTYSGSLPVIGNGVSISIPLSGTATGSTSGSSTPPVTSPVTSSGVTVTPASVSFGSVPLGTSSSHTITIHNNGTTRLTLGSLTLLGSGFKLASVPSDLLMAAGTSLTFNVVFTPVSVTSYSGTLRVVVGGVVVDSIPVTGTGIPALASAQ
jgi:hypothetical protein